MEESKLILARVMKSRDSTIWIRDDLVDSSRMTVGGLSGRPGERARERKREPPQWGSEEQATGARGTNLALQPQGFLLFQAQLL
jgi:hypothetical protein